MARKLVGRFEPTTITEQSNGVYIINGTFIDESGNFGPSNISINDRIYFYDLTNSVIRYKITSILQNTVNPIEIIVSWDDDGVVVEPNYNASAIVDVSLINELPEDVPFTQQLIEEALASGIRSQANRSIIDKIKVSWERIQNVPLEFTPIAHNHNVSSIIGTLSPGQLPIATISTAGIVKIGNGLTVDQNGLISSTGEGTGDMLSSIYDPTKSGKVVSSVTADFVDWSGINNKPDSFTPVTHIHSANDITQDIDNRFVTDVQISNWNSKQNELGFTPENITNKNIANGYAGLDSNIKIPLSLLPQISATNITTDISHQFVSDAQISEWTIGYTPENIANKNIANGYVGLEANSKISSDYLPTINTTDITNGLGYTPENITNKNVANGYVGLESNLKINPLYLPPLVMTNVHTVSSESAQLLLSLQEGDVVIRTDINTTFVHNGGTSGTIADYSEIVTPTSVSNVSSVNGKTGIVTLTYSDVGAAAFSHAHVAADITQDTTHKFVTDAQISNWNSKQTELGFTPENIVNKNIANGYAGLDNNGLLYKSQVPSLESTDIITALGFTPENVANKGISNGYATLDANGKLSSSQIPLIALTSVYTVASEINQLALSLQEGDVVIRTDENKTYIKNSNINGNMSDFSEILNPVGNVSSVNGKTGVVTLTPSDIGASPIVHAHLASSITDDSLHRFVTDAQITIWNNKAEPLSYTAENIANKNIAGGYVGLDENGYVLISQIPQLSYGNMNKTTYDTNNNGIVDLAESVEWSGILNKPTSFVPVVHQHLKNDITDFSHIHVATEITEDSDHKFVTNSQIAYWDSKASALGYTAENIANKDTANGYAGLDENEKLSISQFPLISPSYIIVDLNHRFVTDAQISTWDAKANVTHTHVASNITEDASHRFVTDTQISTWNSKQDALGFTPENIANKSMPNGYASLDSNGTVPVGELPTMPSANIISGLGYTPENISNKNIISGYAGLDSSGLLSTTQIPNISATKIITDATHRMVTDAKISEWDSKVDENHLHDAADINQDTSNRFVTDAQITLWNNKQNALGYVAENITHKNVANGYAGLDEVGKILLSQLPSIPSSSISIASSTNLGLVQIGDGINVDENGVISVDINAAGVNSVNGKTGIVTLTPSDIGAQVSLGFTPENLSNKNIANGYAGLDASGKLIASLLPTISAANVVVDSTHNFVTDTQISTWNSKVDVGHTHIKSDITDFTHSHGANDITQDTNNRFVTDTQITIWNSKQTALGFTPENSSNKNIANGYAGLDNNLKLTSSHIPIATPDVVGGVKIGSGITVDAEGTISAAGGSGGVSLYEYDASGSGCLAGDCWIKASALGVTCEKSGIIATMNIPDGVVVVSARLRINPSDFAGGTTYNFVYDNRIGSADWTNAYHPIWRARRDSTPPKLIYNIAETLNQANRNDFAGFTTTVGALITLTY